MERHRDDGYLLSTDPCQVDVDRVHGWLAFESYWATGRDREVVDRTLAASRVYSVRRDGEQCAFARAVTDLATFAWICDVFVGAGHRGRGLGTWLVENVVADLRGFGIRRIVLATEDAHEVYRRCGFSELEGAWRFMEIDDRPTRAAVPGTTRPDGNGVA
jgi:GNAT superfamily N-acetyltransferase